MSARRRFASIFAGVTLLAIVGMTIASRAAESPSPYAPDPEALAAQDRSVDPAGPTVLRASDDLASRARWTIVTYESSDGTCLDLWGEPFDGGGRVTLSNCGQPEDPLLWGQGGASVGDSWYNLAFGKIPEGTSSVQVGLVDGTQVTDDLVAGGVWFVVNPAEPTDSSSSFKLVQALDASGALLAEAKAASNLADVRKAEAEIGASQSPSGG
jgi:hypothetical protein